MFVIGRHYPDQYRSTYQDYDHYPYPNTVGYPGTFTAYGQADYGERPPTPPSPSERSESPPSQHQLGIEAIENIAIIFLFRLKSSIKISILFLIS